MAGVLGATLMGAARLEDMACRFGTGRPDRMAA